MKIRLGLKSDLINKLHHSVEIISTDELILENNSLTKKYPANTKIFAVGKNSSIYVNDMNLSGPVLFKNLKNGNINLNLSGVSSKTSAKYHFNGNVEINNLDGKLVVILLIDLEDYVRFVLSSEVPAQYEFAAKKAQAVIARTYALKPRVDHTADGFLVCSSYLCCQAFHTGNSLTSATQITDSTRGQILTWENKPILAMFSANAGGHTENFENCFSDIKTNIFPAKPLPYLRGVAEGELPKNFPDVKALKELFYCPYPKTKDAWSKSFRWQLRISANSLESHMHHLIDTLRKTEQFSPFIQSPASNTFGHINKFDITQRGVSGTAMYLDIHTSHGIWKVSKELTIRQVFGNPDLNLKRLRSARIIIEHDYDKLGLLKEINILGLGTGHGVGLQQDGAQGFAKAGFTYKQILNHYYPNAVISTV